MEFTYYHSLIDFQKLLFVINSTRLRSCVFETITLYFFLIFLLKEVIWLKILYLNFKTMIKSLQIFSNQAFLSLYFSLQPTTKGFSCQNSFLKHPYHFHFCFALLILRLVSFVGLNLIAQKLIFNLMRL